MWIGCEACGQEISAKDCGCSARAREKSVALKAQLQETEGRLWHIREAVLVVLSSIAHREALEGVRTLEVSKENLDRLWAAAECRWHDSKTADSFLGEVLVHGRVSLDAGELFCDKSARHKTYAGEKIPMLRRLGHLRDSLLSMYSFHGWKERFELTPEDVAQRLASGK